MSKLFLPQAQLEEWALSDRADVHGDRLGVAGESTTYSCTEAVHFIQLVSGADDQGLMLKVKTLPQLDALHAEHMMTSVLFGDTAYEVVQGYVVEARAEEVLAAAPPPVHDAADPSGRQETDLLAAFLLNKM